MSHQSLKPEQHSTSAWKRFWEKGDWWRAILLAAAYYALYQLGGLLLAPIVPGLEQGSSAWLLVTMVIPIVWGCLLLVLFAWSVGWLRELFARQPIGGAGWMWIAVVVVLAFNVLRFATTDLGEAGFEYVATWLLGGLAIGFAEEVLTRGFVVNMMRKAGHREIAVATVSAAVFAGLHAGNLIGGQAIITTLVQLLYTFAFGICMYLAMRVTRSLIAPILLHASTDPTIYLQTMYPADGPLTSMASLGNIAVIITGLVLLIFIRGRVAVPSADAFPEVRATA